MISANNPYAFHLWFIQVLYIIQIIIFIIEKYFFIRIRNDVSFWIISFLSTLLFSTFIFSTDNIILKVLYRLPWFIAGILFDKLKLEKIESKLFGSLAGLVGLLSMILCITIGDRYGFNIVMRFIRNFMCIPLVIYFFVYFSKVISKSNNGSKGLSSIGRNSFSIYLVHQPFCCAFLGMIMLKILPRSLVIYFVCIAVCIVSSLLLPQSLYFIAEKTHCNRTLNSFMGIKFDK